MAQEKVEIVQLKRFKLHVQILMHLLAVDSYKVSKWTAAALLSN